MKDLVNTSTDISILVQIITGIVGIDGIFKKLDPIHRILQYVLGFELSVQAFELLYYIYLIKPASIESMASIRYFNWVFSTPVMLITTITYFKYEELLEKFKTTENKNEKLKFKQQLENLKFFDFLKENKNNIITIVICNFFMLLFGYLGEIGYSDTLTTAIFGFAFFFMSFFIVYDKYAKFSIIGNKMFTLLFAVWSFYGLAFVLDPVSKNISFNTLDVIAKNFFGIYLYFKILQTQTN